MHYIISYALKFSRDETFAVFAVRKTTANSLIREYFEQVLRNRKKMNAEQCPCSLLAFVLDRKYKYEQRFVRYQLDTKFPGSKWSTMSIPSHYPRK